MRKVVAFLVWLFSFWTWKAFFLRWFGRPSSHPASGATAEQLASQEGQQESELARFLSSLPRDERRCELLNFYYDSKVYICFGPSEFELVHDTGTEASSYREFLGAVASSEIVFHEEVSIIVWGPESCKHVEAFAMALRQSGHGFRKLEFDCAKCPAIPFVKCASSVLLANDAIQELGLHFLALELDKEEATEFVSLIVVPDNLRILKSFTMYNCKLDGEGMEQLLKPFQAPSNVLEVLSIIPITSDDQLEHISVMLGSSTSLKGLEVSIPYNEVKSKEVFVRGYTNLATTLCSNQSLESLICIISCSMELKVLLDPLMPKNNHLQFNTSLTRLVLRGSIGGKEGIESLVDMLCSNTSLLTLGLIKMDDFSALLGEEGITNVLVVLEALKANKFLKQIGFSGCTAVNGHKVFGAIMDLLLENHCIEDIDLSDTGLMKTGDADYVYTALSKRKKMKLWNIVQGMANVNPTSGRVFLCGNPYAGKTRLRLSMKKLKEFQEKHEVQKRVRIRDIMKTTFKISSAPRLSSDDIFLERTHGIEVDTILYNGIGITIWDMAGQTDYHSFEELVMPNLSADGSCSLFLLMCNPMDQWIASKRKTISNIKIELASWLRFIASNTRRSLSFHPHVSIVMTHYDHWMEDTIFVERISDVVLELKSQFDEVLEFDKGDFVFKVDGRDVTYARGVFDFIQSHLKQLLERLPKTVRACEEVQHLVALWNADQTKPPLLKWDEFCEDLCKEVKELNDADNELARMRKEFVATSLNDGGHIIYNEKAKVVITNPHWFCHHIIGEFLHQCATMNHELEIVSTNGIVSKEHMKRLILKLVEGQGDLEMQFDDILGTMIKLHICYEQDAHCIMIPCTLKDKYESLCWSRKNDSTRFVYVGRRLACQDGIKTMLSLGFFSRLQVSFFMKLQSKNAQDTYEVFQDVIKFISDGIEVILQFHHGDVDILLRSQQCQDKMLEFLKGKIVGHIEYLQADPTLGCPGVRLIEYIIRPSCVQRLVDSKDRKNQCVLVEDLEVEVIKNGVEATHNWKQCEGLDTNYDKVSTLLGSMAWKNLLEKRSHHLQAYHKTVQSLETMTPNVLFNSNNDNSDLAIGSFWQTTRRFVYGSLDDKLDNIIRLQLEHHKETMSKLKDVVHMIQHLEHDIEKIQGELLHQVCSKIDGLMAFSLEMQQSQIPKLAYLCEIGKRKLLTRFVPGLHKIQLHLMCESMQGFHEVYNQEGCVVTFGTEHTKRFLAMLNWGLKIVTILTKIGAHVACGMGEMVPNFSDVGGFAALILDTPGVLEYQMPMTILESIPIDVRNQLGKSIGDTSEAQRWLRGFLEPKCQNKQDFYEKFQLKKVRYKLRSRCIAWICHDCFSKHQSEIDELK